MTISWVCRSENWGTDFGIICRLAIGAHTGDGYGIYTIDETIGIAIII